MTKGVLKPQNIFLPNHLKEETQTTKKYLNPTTLYAEAEARYKELSKIYQIVNSRISKYPDGKIHIINSSGKIQFYLRLTPNDKSGKYISKKDTRLIKKFVQKKYDEELLKYVHHELTQLEKFLKKTNSSTIQVRNLYSQNPEEIKKYINPIDISDEDYIRDWLNQPFERKPILDNVPTYITNNQEHVRSKSELNIANALKNAGIPYKYECPITLANGNKIFPDFTLLDIRNRREVIWEHRGMMDVIFSS